eukprot:m.368490 g.368490  ORF g.368490 m.368490 type:complete len:97 (+) comp45172_c0_seq1:1066-1356(+)
MAAFTTLTHTCVCMGKGGRGKACSLFAVTSDGTKAMCGSLSDYVAEALGVNPQTIVFVMPRNANVRWIGASTAATTRLQTPHHQEQSSLYIAWLCG